MRCCIRRVQSCPGNKLRHEITCVVLRHRWRNWTLLADVVEERPPGPLELEVGNLSAMVVSGVVGADYIKELDVNLC